MSSSTLPPWQIENNLQKTKQDMCNSNQNIRASGRAALAGTILCFGFGPAVKADVDPHVQQDTFDAEVAALLPAANFLPPPPPLPTERITLGDWSGVIAWTPHIP